MIRSVVKSWYLHGRKIGDVFNEKEIKKCSKTVFSSFQWMKRHFSSFEGQKNGFMRDSLTPSLSSSRQFPSSSLISHSNWSKVMKSSYQTITEAELEPIFLMDEEDIYDDPDEDLDDDSHLEDFQEYDNQEGNSYRHRHHTEMSPPLILTEEEIHSIIQYFDSLGPREQATNSVYPAEYVRKNLAIGVLLSPLYITRFGPPGATVYFSTSELPKVQALIPKKEIDFYNLRNPKKKLSVGDEITAFVSDIRRDGRVTLQLTPNFSKVDQIHLFMRTLQEFPNATLPLGSSSSSSEIASLLPFFSRTSFKMICGKLATEGYVKSNLYETRLIDDSERYVRMTPIQQLVYVRNVSLFLGRFGGFKKWLVKDMLLSACIESVFVRHGQPSRYSEGAPIPYTTMEEEKLLEEALLKEKENEENGIIDKNKIELTDAIIACPSVQAAELVIKAIDGVLFDCRRIRANFLQKNLPQPKVRKQATAKFSGWRSALTDEPEIIQPEPEPEPKPIVEEVVVKEKSRTKSIRPGRRYSVCIKSLPYSVTPEEVKSLVEDVIGSKSIGRVHLLTDKNSKQSKGICFIDVRDADAVRQVVKRLQGRKVKNRSIVVTDGSIV